MATSKAEGETVPRWRDVQAAALAAPARGGDLADLARRATAWLGSAADYGSGGPARSMACSRAVRQRGHTQPAPAVQLMPAPPQVLLCGITAAPDQVTD